MASGLLQRETWINRLSGRRWFVAGKQGLFRPEKSDRRGTRKPRRSEGRPNGGRPMGDAWRDLLDAELLAAFRVAVGAELFRRLDLLVDDLSLQVLLDDHRRHEELGRR